MPEGGTDRLEVWSKLAQVLSVVMGVVISVFSFNDARVKEADTRRYEAQKYSDQRGDEAANRRREAAKPFLELRQRRYMEAIQAAGVLANPGDHTKAEKAKAEKRFWELYWAELSLVEAPEVEASMMKLGEALEADQSQHSA